MDNSSPAHLTDAAENGDLRSRLLKSSTPKSEIVEYEGMELEVKQMRLRDRKLLFTKCRDKNGNIDGVDLLVWSVIRGTFYPGTNKRVFEDADYDTLLNQTGGVVDALSPAINRVSGAEDTLGNEETASDETQMSA